MLANEQRASKRLTKYKNQILEEWERLVRRDVPPAKLQGRLALRNSLSEVLDEIILALDDPNPERTLSTEELRLAVGHGQQRAKNANYSLEQVISEYHILRKVLFDYLENGYELSRKDRDLIWDVLFLAIKNAASEFKQFRDIEKNKSQETLGKANVYLKETLGEVSAESVLKSQLLKTIFERVDDYAIFTLDPHGVITSWASGAQKMKQYSPKEAIGSHFSMLYPKEGRLRKEPEDHLVVAAKEGRFRGEGLRQRKNGELFLADVFITPMYEAGKLIGFFKIVADLTARNRIIQERDLTRTRVESLELESELRERFVFTLSHDLKNPLSAIKMSLLLTTKENCEVSKHRELSQRSIQIMERVDRMINNLLDASRIKSGQGMTLTLEEFDLSEVIHDINEELATVYGDRFRIETPPSFVGYWDRNGLVRAIENLLINAIKYGDPLGMVTTTLKTIEDRAVISVHNFGVPILPEDQESLFGQFHRTKSATQGHKKGWGLGLTIVRGITEAHGGVVKVKSIPYEGTTFTLDLPRDTRSILSKAA